MKKLILTMTVLLFCVSTGFSLTEREICESKVCLQYLQDMYALVKNEKPDYEPVVTSLIKRIADMSHQGYDDDANNNALSMAMVESQVLGALFSSFINLFSKDTDRIGRANIVDMEFQRDGMLCQRYR